MRKGMWKMIQEELYIYLESPIRNKNHINKFTHTFQNESGYESRKTLGKYNVEIKQKKKSNVKQKRGIRLSRQHIS